MFSSLRYTQICTTKFDHPHKYLINYKINEECINYLDYPNLAFWIWSLGMPTWRWQTWSISNSMKLIICSNLIDLICRLKVLFRRVVVISERGVASNLIILFYFLRVIVRVILGIRLFQFWWIYFRKCRVAQLIWEKSIDPMFIRWVCSLREIDILNWAFRLVWAMINYCLLGAERLDLAFIKIRINLGNYCPNINYLMILVVFLDLIIWSIIIPNLNMLIF